MARDPFTTSSGGARLKGYVGRLGLFTPTAFEEKGFTGGPYGPTDLVRANVVFLDEGLGEDLDPDEAEVVDGMSIISGPVVKDLNDVLTLADPSRPSHLGRVKEVPNKRGQNPIIVLAEATEEDKKLARAYLAWARAPKDEF